MEEKDFTEYFELSRKMYTKCVDYLVNLLKDREDRTYELNSSFTISLDYEGIFFVNKITLDEVNDLQLVGADGEVRDAYEVYNSDLISIANQVFEELN